ncbi:MAG: stage III sporulation protein AG, partial [Clostridia bacterium]|nr:stage III sporulation protein AG [Clostridia bacterium]
MVTLESSAEQYYQKNVKSRSDTNSAEREESVVFEDKKPIPVKEIMPEVKGVAVVCDGAVSTGIMQRVIGLISCALDLPANRIYVTY